MPLFYGLWAIALAIASSIFGKQEWLTIGIFCISCFLFLVAGVGYFYFSKTKPDYLRSEEYHLKKQSLEILGDKDNILKVDASHIVNITKPDNKQLPGGGKTTI